VCNFRELTILSEIWESRRPLCQVAHKRKGRHLGFRTKWVHLVDLQAGQVLADKERKSSKQQRKGGDPER